MTRIVIFCCLVVAGCRSEPAAQVAQRAPVPPPASAAAPAVLMAVSDSTALPTRPASDWLTYDGESFTLNYPPNATLAPARSHPRDVPGTAITGPAIHLPVAPDVGPSDGPAYRLIISTFPNPRRLSAWEWVEDVRREENAGPLDVDSIEFVGPADSLHVGGTGFLRLRPFCGDCEPEELYLVAGDRAVMLSYIFDISVPGDRDRQRKVYEAILETFRWKKQASRP